MFFPGVPDAYYTPEWFFVRLGQRCWPHLWEVPWTVLSNVSWAIWIFVPIPLLILYTLLSPTIYRVPPTRLLNILSQYLFLFPENELPGQSGTPKLLTQGVLEMVSHHCSGQEFTWHFFYLCQYRAQLFFLIFLLQVQNESRRREAEDGMV